MLKALILNHNTPHIGGAVPLLLGLWHTASTYGAIGLYQAAQTPDFWSSILEYPMVAFIVFLSLKAAQMWAENNREWREAMSEQNDKNIANMMQMQQTQTQMLEDALKGIQDAIANIQVTDCPYIAEIESAKRKAQTTKS